MEVVIIFLRFIKQTSPTSILHSSFFIPRISFYSSFFFYSSFSFLYFPYSFLFFILLSLFFVFLFYNVLKALSNSEFSSFVPTVMRRQLWQRVMRVRLRTMIPLATR